MLDVGHVLYSVSGIVYILYWTAYLYMYVVECLGLFM